MNHSWIWGLIGPLFFSLAAPALQVLKSEDSDLRYRYLILNDDIKMGDGARIEKVFGSWLKDAKPIAILLTSPGGVLEEVPDLEKAIVDAGEKSKRLYDRPVLLVINEECSSACAALTATLTARSAQGAVQFAVLPIARVAFHQPFELRDGQVQPYADPEEKAAAIQRQIDFLLKAGVSASWLEAHRSAFESINLTWFKAENLILEKSGIFPPDSLIPADVTDVVSALEEGRIGLGSRSSMTTGPNVPPFLKPSPNFE